MATITPVTCLAKTGKDQKSLWAKARIDGSMKETEGDVIKLLSYEHLTGLGDTETGGQLANIFHKACQDASDLLASKIKVQSRKDCYVEAMSVLDGMLTDKEGGVCSVFGKGLLAQATRNLSGLTFTKTEKTGEVSDEGVEVETETL
jgi:hypothetical protein